MLGLETALAVALTHTDVPLAKLLALLSWQPARIAGLDGHGHGGPIVEGAAANLCVVDPEEVWVVEPARLASRSRNTPFAGRKLTGRVRHTLLRGEPVVVDGVAQR
jgi:dihydroorotase